MKGILEFQLPEDQESFEYAQNGILYSMVLDDLDNWLRSKFKYEDQETISIEEVRSKLGELLTERNLNG
jgi:hypothetical protein